MTKTLTAIGNSLGLIIDRPILDLLKIDKDTVLEIRTDGKALIIIEPASADSRKSRVRVATERLMNAHDKTLRRLAK